MPDPTPAPDATTPIGPHTRDAAERGDAALLRDAMAGPPSALTCPQCGGALWEQGDGQFLHYRCHVGHRYTADSMAAEHEALLESTLWEALRMFQEKAALHRRIAQSLMGGEHSFMVERHRELAHDSEVRTELLRRILLGEPQVADRCPTSGGQ